MGLDPVVYSRCPGCDRVTAPAWQLREGDPPRPVPVEICCAACATVYVVSDPGELHTELDAVVWHPLCRAVVRCPQVAHVVRCTQRGPDVSASAGCGDLIDGPAAGGPTPPPPSAPDELLVPPSWRPRPAPDSPADTWTALSTEATRRRQGGRDR